MIYEAKVMSVEIKSEDGINKIFLTCEAQVGNNIQALLYNPAGDYSIPLPDDFVSILKVPGSGNYIAIGNLNNIASIEKGEKYLYSRNSSGTEKASIFLDKDGKITINTDDEIDLNGGGTVKIDATTDIELNGNTKKFVTYTELNTALQAMVGVANGLFLTAADNGVKSGGLTVDISASETTTIKTGG